MFDYKLSCYTVFLERMPPGVFHAPSDTLETFTLDPESDWTFENVGFTALAHPSSLEIGTSHGVYVLEEPEQALKGNSTVFKCSTVLQKPTVANMRAASAVLKSCGEVLRNGEVSKSQEFVYTDSCFYFEHEISKKLLTFYRSQQPIRCRRMAA